MDYIIMRPKEGYEVSPNAETVKKIRDSIKLASTPWSVGGPYGHVKPKPDINSGASVVGREIKHLEKIDFRNAEQIWAMRKSLGKVSCAQE